LCLQNGLEKKVEKSRKQKKERRNRARKVRGAKKNSCECYAGQGQQRTTQVLLSNTICQMAVLHSYACGAALLVCSWGHAETWCSLLLHGDVCSHTTLTPVVCLALLVPAAAGGKK
jgi:hypothetical protein